MSNFNSEHAEGGWAKPAHRKNFVYITKEFLERRGNLLSPEGVGGGIPIVGAGL